MLALAATTAPPVAAGADLGYLALGIVFLAIGLITLLLTAMRTASREASVFLFGAMSCLWGLRFLLYTRQIPALLTDDVAGLERAARGLTYFGGAAAFGFGYAYLGAGWRGTLRILAWLSLAFAVGAGAVLAFVADRNLLLPAFSVLVVAGAVVVIANTLHPQLREQARRDGFLPGVVLSVLFFVLENLRALGVVPVAFDVEWIGVLVLYVTLGRIIAMRVFRNENRLAALRQELATARQIQNSLLPRQAPQIPGVAIATRYVPMSQVAGDIYDFVALDRARLAVLIADVAGHGVAAALIASMVKGAFRAQTDVMDRPDRVLAGMNRILCGQLEAKFVTAFCLVIDTERKILRCAGAGHPPLLVRENGDGGFREVESDGLILGQFPEATYASTELPLAPESRMILCTDGILEAENDREEQFGDGALARFLEENRGLPAAQLVDRLTASVVAWVRPQRGRTLDDDLTLIVVDVV